MQIRSFKPIIKQRGTITLIEPIWGSNVESQDLEQRILQHVNQANYKAVKPTAIGRKLRLSAEEQKTVRMTVKRLVQKKN